MSSQLGCNVAWHNSDYGLLKDNLLSGAGCFSSRSEFFWLSLQCAYGHRWFYVCLSRNRLHQSFHWSLQLFASFSFKRKITNDSPLGCGYQINNRKIKSRKTNKRTQTTVTLSSPSSWTIDSKCRRLLAAIKHYIRERQSRVTNAY